MLRVKKIKVNKTWLYSGLQKSFNKNDTEIPENDPISNFDFI